MYSYGIYTGVQQKTFPYYAEVLYYKVDSRLTKQDSASTRQITNVLQDDYNTISTIYSSMIVLRTRTHGQV